LVTNTFDVCQQVQDSEKVKAVHGEFFTDNLPENFFKNICNDLKNKNKVDYIRKKPFKHQQECIDVCLKYFLENNADLFWRAYVELACGSGKSLMAFWLTVMMKVKRTVIFVPSLYLLSQFYTDWINQSYAEGVKINYLLIGSDADVDDKIKYKSPSGITLLTDYKLIKEHIKNVKKDEQLVVISTYQSADKLAKACEENIKFDFGIFDEAHKTVGQAGKQFSLMLTDDNMVIHKRLFMTATPKIYGGKGSLEEDDIISMDDEKYYGKKLYCYNTGNAINDKKLVDYQLITILTKDDNMKKFIEENKLVKFKKEFTEEYSQYLAIIIILLKKIHDGTSNHIVTYHNTVNRANKFKKIIGIINELLYKGSDLYIDSLDGSKTMSNRKRIVNNFVEAKNGILCSNRVLNEGVNIPCIDGICFVDNRNSCIDIVQCIGRSFQELMISW